MARVATAAPGLFWYLFLRHRTPAASVAPPGVFPSMDFTDPRNSAYVAAISAFAA